MIRKRTKTVKAFVYRYKPYSGSTQEWIQGEWYDSTGTRHTGVVDLFDLIGQGMGMVPKAGDQITVTVEIEKPSGEHPECCQCQACLPSPHAR